MDCPGNPGTLMAMKAYPTYVRPQEQVVVAGVASGLASHLRVDVLYVRLALVLLSALSGMGLLLYAGLWVFSKQGEVPAPPQRREISQAMNYVLVALAVIVAGLASISLSGVPVGLIVALIVAGVGAYLVWRGFDAGSRARTFSIIGGAVLVVFGLLSGLAIGSPQDFLGSLVAVVFTLAGVAIFAVPAMVRVRDSMAEKAAAEERALIASRLHDSVLQTLALIQKRADQPEEVVRLSRAQERELRTWLFEPKEAMDLTVFAAIEKASGEVEDLYGVRIAPVTVGTDAALTEQTQAVILAAREAMVNAAKHAGVEKLDVYAEAFEGLEIFVRDRGQGFDPEDIPEDRHGIRDSIIGRVEKAGGSATINSEPGEGTEVILRTW